jgi:hypothetical protein
MKINAKEFQQIIKEEALRLKRKMMLEAEKESILKRLNEMQECEMMEDVAMGAPAGDAQITPQVASAVEKSAQAVLSRVSPEMLAKAEAELQAAGLTGSQEDIKNRVEDMLPMNESIMNEAWDKSKIYNWLIGGGIGTALAGIVATILGSIPTQQLSDLADYSGATVTPNASVIAGLIAIAIGTIGIGAGAKGRYDLAADKGKMSPEQAAAIIAKRKATRGR